jgi:hypothetical protein
MATKMVGNLSEKLFEVFLTFPMTLKVARIFNSSAVVLIPLLLSIVDDNFIDDHKTPGKVLFGKALLRRLTTPANYTR